MEKKDRLFYVVYCKPTERNHHAYCTHGDEGASIEDIWARESKEFPMGTQVTIHDEQHNMKNFVKE